MSWLTCLWHSFLSSPKPKAHGELLLSVIVRRLSCVRRSSSVNSFLKALYPEPLVQIKKNHINATRDDRFHKCINGSAPLNRRATRAPDKKSF